ncbi:hypothetical protein FRC17_009611 [Serendipita sp. 399]|nr:hypothetical protein FRC17_009611 [Serendipita sp. 399]
MQSNLIFDQILNANPFFPISQLDPFLPKFLHDRYGDALDVDKPGTAKALDKLTKQFVANALADDAATELGIRSIRRIVGVTALDEDGHVLYLTCCELQVGNTIQVVFVKRPPNAAGAKRQYFLVPKEGPNSVPPLNDLNNPDPGSLPDPSNKEHGFKALEEPALLSPVWDGPDSKEPLSDNSNSEEKEKFLMMYSYDRGIPLIDRNKREHLAINAYPRFAWELVQYCAHDPNNQNEVGNERFIFTGYSKGTKKRHSLEGFYMRLGDLKKSIEAGSSGTAENDLVLLKNNEPLWPLWLPNGTLIPVDKKNSHFKDLDPAGSKDRARKLYLNYCKLVRLARINGQGYDVLSRFWDMPWNPIFHIHIDPGNDSGIKKKILEYAQMKATGNEIAKVDGEISADDRALVALIEKIKSNRVFKPQIRIFWGTGVVPGLQRWGSHPNGLYTEVGVYRDERPGKLKELEEVDKDLCDRLQRKYANAVAPFVTVTKVTEASINIVKNYKREPSQIVVVGNLSPNDFVRKWWNVRKGEKAAEWLHRSAWSYGGLYQNGKVDPQSSQDVRNLIIGTHETNTMMLRVELFVKRLAQYATERDDSPITVTVTTQNANDGEETQQYAWYCPRLIYTVQTAGDSSVLDELFERMVYGWNESVPAEKKSDPIEEEWDSTGKKLDPLEEELDPTEEKSDPIEEESDPTEEKSDPIEEEADFME